MIGITSFVMQEPDTEIGANMLDALNECLQVGTFIINLTTHVFTKISTWVGWGICKSNIKHN